MEVLVQTWSEILGKFKLKAGATVIEL